MPTLQFNLCCDEGVPFSKEMSFAVHVQLEVWCGGMHLLQYVCQWVLMLELGAAAIVNVVVAKVYLQHM